MNIKALITTLVIGSSSIALADPSWQAGVHVDNDGDVDAGVVIRDHRGYEPAPAPATVPSYWPQPVYQAPISPPTLGWVELRQPTKIVGGRDFVTVHARRRFSQITLQSDGGRTRVAEVAIQFRDGTWQTLRPNMMLDAQNSTLTIDLSERAQINRICVYGSSGRLGRYSILAA